MSGSQQRRLSAQINLGLTPVEAAIVDAAAAAERISRAALARRHLLAAVGQADTTPARRSTALPPEDVAVVAGLSGQLGRTTGAAIQLAKTLRQVEPGGRVHAEAESVLIDLRRHAAALAVIVERLT